MKTSDRIANCQRCYDYAKSIQPDGWDELYQKAWLKIKEKEVKDPSWEVEHYKTYFYATLKSIKLDELRKKTKDVVVYSEAIESGEKPEKDIWEIESSVLHSWINKRVNDDYIRMLQEIADLSIRFKKVTKAAEFVREQMSERTFYKYLAEAKKEIDYEYFLLTDCHPLYDADMVRLS